MIAIAFVAQLAAAQASPEGPTPQQHFAAIRAQCFGFQPIPPQELAAGVECVAREDQAVFAHLKLTADKKAAVDVAYEGMRVAAAAAASTEKAIVDEAGKKVIAIDDQMLAHLGVAVERLGKAQFIPQNREVDIYPLQAQLRGIGGVAVVKCWVDAKGAMADCKTIAVGPPGVGFEEAAPKLAALRKMKPVVLNRARIADIPVTFTLNFAIGE